MVLSHLLRILVSPVGMLQPGIMRYGGKISQSKAYIEFYSANRFAKIAE